MRLAENAFAVFVWLTTLSFQLIFVFAQDRLIYDRREPDPTKLESRLGDPPLPELPSPVPASKQPIPEADVSSGALAYRIKIPVPAGRLGMQPDLDVVYNSLNTELGSQVGYGWELSLPSIERRNVNGVNKLFNSRDFSSTLNGELREQTSDTFVARVDPGSALRYEFLGSGNSLFWKVTDKQGKQYLFGESEASRLSHPNDDTKIFKWYLTKILDRNGNSVDFAYQKVNSQVYLQEITYTNHQSSTGVFKVVPEYEDRPDVTLTARPGFLISWTKRLTRIKAFFGNELTNETQLTYVQHPASNQSMLGSVRHIGYSVQGQGASQGPWSFEYDSTGATGLMTGVQLPSGGELSVSYIPSAQVIDQATNALGNGKFPYSFYLVRKIEYLETGNPTRHEQFQYTGGAFYFANPLDKRVAGFEKVVQTDGAGNMTTTFYHQGNANNKMFGEVGDQYEKLGRPYKVEERSASGELFTRSTNRWEYLGAGTDNGRTQLKSTLIQQFDGNKDHKDSAVEYTYDGFGNVTLEKKLGEVSGNGDGTYVDIGTDTITTESSYARPVSASSYVVGMPSKQLVLDAANIRKSETFYFYDGLEINLVNKGNPTKEQRWIQAGAYAETNKAFDGFGQVVASTDPNNNITTILFDQFNLYRATVTNALGQSTQYEYDYSSGEIIRTVDPNGRVFETEYDGLDRVVHERQPDVSNPSTLVSKSEFVYTDQPNNVSVRKIERLDETIAVESIEYADGFGRTIQERTQAEQPGQLAVRDRSYDNRGLLQRESLPYFSAGLARTPPTSEDSLYASYSYDPLKRIVSVTNAVGTTTNSYNKWKTTVTDANGMTKMLYKDAFDRLVRVDERNGAETYATRYDYDPIGSLLRITDVLGNVRNFSYDGLGRRTAAEDLHAPGDGTFGIWLLTYDNANNLTQRTDPKGQTARFEYDRLNRVRNEDFLAQAGIEVNYFYDSCPDGIGRLCGDFTGTVSRSREYNALGSIKKETTTVVGAPYTTLTHYDYQANIRLLTNPDGSQLKYDYNLAGLLDAVSSKEHGQAGLSAIVSDFDYSPTNAIEEIVYPSGTRTINTYDPNEIYRLKRKYTTVGSGTGVIQDLNYSFDAVGNIRRIDDKSNLNSRKTLNYLYDDLHRLVYAAATKLGGPQMYRQTFKYDALGNLAYKSDQGNYLYDGDQGDNYANPHAATTIGVRSVSFDRNGNIDSIAGQTIYSWDHNNRLRQSSVGGNIAAYDYTSDGERVVYDTGVSRVISPSKFYSETASNGVEKHVYAGGSLLATIRGTGSQATIYYDHTDHLGGTNVVTREGGTVSERLEYYPFGSIHLDSGAVNERRKFGGHEFDKDTSLSYLGARYYSGTQGRFMSIDPVFLSVTANLSDPQALHSYSYGRNNPLRFIDLDGNSWLETYVTAAGSFANNLNQGLIEKNAQKVLAFVANENGFNRLGTSAAKGYSAIPLIAPIIKVGQELSKPNVPFLERAERASLRISDAAWSAIPKSLIGGAIVETSLDVSFEKRVSLIESGGNSLYQYKLNQDLQEKARQRETQSIVTLRNGYSGSSNHLTIQGSSAGFQDSPVYRQTSSPRLQGYLQSSSPCLQGC